MKKLILFIVFFAVLFQISFSVFNIGIINSTVLFGALGGVVYLINPTLNKWMIQDLKILLIFFLIFVLYIVSSEINNYYDQYFIREIILVNIARFLASCFIMVLYESAYKNRFSITTLTNIFAIFLCIQISISMLEFAFPAFRNIISTLTTTSELAQERLEGSATVRAAGIGTYMFFGAGVINSCVLILISLVCTCLPLKRSITIIYIFFYLVISFGGIFISRTTAAGASFGVLLFIFGKRKYISKNITAFFIALVVSFGLLSVFLTTNVGSRLLDLREFGFELLDNVESGSGMQTGSTNRLLEMYEFPDNMKTWTIGDAKWRFGDEYYKQTDVGYLRYIYFFGWIGLGSILLYEFVTIRLASNALAKNKKRFIFAFMTLYLILSLKGMTDFSQFLFCLYNISKLQSNGPAPYLGRHSRLQRRAIS